MSYAVDIDKKLRTVFPPGGDWPLDFHDLRPDLVFHDASSRWARLIEIKTVGTGLRGNLAKYAAATSWLAARGWDAQLLHLVSAGHEDGPRGDWDALARLGGHVMLWEDVLHEAKDSSCEVTTSMPYRNCLAGLINTTCKDCGAAAA